MKNLLVFIFLLFLGSSLFAQEGNDSVHLRLTISSTDLSEDMSQLSSGNDELILLVYESSFAGARPVFTQEFIFDKKVKKKTFEINYTDFKWKTRANVEPTVSIYLVERDSKNSIERIEAPITVYQNEILELFKTKKTVELEKYLGDEDLLLACKFRLYNHNSCKNSYINNLDSYSYKVAFETKK